MLDLLKIIIGLSFLILISIIDFKTYNKRNGYIPSILTTLFLIMSFMLNFPLCIFSGIFGALIGLLLTDLDYWGGIADFKVFVASSMLFNNFVQVSLFTGFVTLIGLFYKYILSKYTTKKYIPFIPVIMISYFLTSLLFAVIL